MLDTYRCGDTRTYEKESELLCRSVRTNEKDRWQHTATAALVAILLTGPILPPACRADETAAVFTRSCAGCHAGGGNSVQPNKTLKKADLDANGLTTVDGIYEVIYSGQNKMPGYGEGCAPKGKCTFAARLSDDVIRELAQFTLSQANAGWPQ